MPDDFIVNQEISAKLSKLCLILFLFDRIPDEEGFSPEDWSLVFWNPVKIVADTSIEVFQVVGGIQLDHCEVIYVEVVVFPVESP